MLGWEGGKGMKGSELLDSLDNLALGDLKGLNIDSLYRLENLLHHWYVLAGDIRRHRCATAKGGPGAPPFTLQRPLEDEHARHPGI